MQITLTPRQIAGLAKVTAAFNLRQGESDNLTVDEFAAKEFGHVAKQWEELVSETIPTGEWLQRWTPAEQAAALGMASQNAQIMDWWLTLLQTANFNLEDPRAKEGVPALCQALQAAGVMTDGAARAAEILSY